MKGDEVEALLSPKIKREETNSCFESHQVVPDQNDDGDLDDVDINNLED